MNQDQTASISFGKKKIQSSISLDINMVAWLEQLADRCSKNRSEVVRDALNEYLPKLEYQLDHPASISISIDEAAASGR